MKLCKKNLYVGVVIGVTSLVLLSNLCKEDNSQAGSFISDKIMEEIEKETFKNRKAVKEKPHVIIPEEELALDEDYINNETLFLGIKNVGEKMGNSYKVLRCKDESNHYKAMIVLTYVDYEIEDEKTVTIYRVCDAFTKTELFKTDKVNEYFDIKNIYDKSECFSEYTIISLDSLDDTLKYTIIDNASDEELKVLPNNINNCWINEYDIAKIYVSLISKDNRVSFNKNEDKVLTY